MIDKKSRIEQIIRQILNNLPADPRQLKHGLEKNLRAALNAAFARMELVSREEFDIQSALLQRTRASLDEMEEKVEQLEQSLKGRFES